MTKVKVIDFDGTETVYEVKNWPDEKFTQHCKGTPICGITGIGYHLTTLEGVDIIIHPETVKRIEVYKGDELCSKIEQRTHGKDESTPNKKCFLYVRRGRA